MKSFKAFGRDFEYVRNDLQCVLGERCIEIPIFLDILKSIGVKHGAHVLEIGNVLKKYDTSLNHIVVDKYEKSKGVVNVDLLNYKHATKFDCIFSISTLEHIGFDMGEEKDPNKIEKVFQWVSENLAQCGDFYFSFPLGYNPYLEDFLRNKQSIGELKFSWVNYFQRFNIGNEWLQIVCNEQTLREAKYNSPFPYGNILFIGAMTK